MGFFHQLYIWDQDLNRYGSVQELRSIFGHLKSVRFGWFWFGLLGVGMFWFGLVSFSLVWLVLVWFGWFWFGLDMFALVDLWDIVLLRN